MDVLDRHSVSVLNAGAPDPALVFVHGFGCDQSMWHATASHFEDHPCVLLDLVGFGDSDLAAFDVDRYSKLDGHAADVIDVCRALELERPVLVGHSVGAMICVLAAKEAPELASRLVLVGPSPRYIDADGYVGGFSRTDIEGLLTALEADFISWSHSMAPVIAGNPDRPEHGEHLAETFCRSDPEAAKLFARVTFLSDNRADLASIAIPTLVLQCSDDPIAPTRVGEFVSAHIPDSRFVQLSATGHCPHLTAPDETAAAIRRFLE